MFLIPPFIKLGLIVLGLIFATTPLIGHSISENKVIPWDEMWSVYEKKWEDEVYRGMIIGGLVGIGLGGLLFFVA